MTARDPYKDRADCENLAINCYSLMDRGFYEESATLFSEDGIWVRGEGPVHTRTGILASLRRRPPERLSRHFVSNIVVTLKNENEAEATAYFVALHGTRIEGAAAKLPVPVAAGDLVYRFERYSEGWQITYLEPIQLYLP
jgi:hypothetical protein